MSSNEINARPPDEALCVIEISNPSPELPSNGETHTPMETLTAKTARPRPSDDSDDDADSGPGWNTVKKTRRSPKSSQSTSSSSPKPQIPTDSPRQNKNRACDITLTSDPQVILIRSMTGENIFNHPKVTQNVIDKSVFFPHLIGPKVIVPGTGSCIKLFVKDVNKFDLPNIKHLHSSFPHEVRCTTPIRSQNIYSGVITNISPDYPLEEIKKNLVTTEGNQSNVLKVSAQFSRIDGESKRNSRVRIDFDGPIPKRVSLGYTSYHVSLFVPQPLRCYKCQRYGHGTGSCRYSARCRVCGEHYDKHHKEYERCTRSKKCIHCKSFEHTTGHSHCPTYKKAHDIEYKLAKRQIEFEESRAALGELNQAAPVNHIANAENIINTQPTIAPKTAKDRGATPKDPIRPTNPALLYSQALRTPERPSRTAQTNKENISHTQTASYNPTLTPSSLYPSIFNNIETSPKRNQKQYPKSPQTISPQKAELDKPPILPKRSCLPVHTTTQSPPPVNRPVPPMQPSIPMYHNMNPVDSDKNITPVALGSFLFRLLILLQSETDKNFIPVFLSLSRDCFGISLPSLF